MSEIKLNPEAFRTLSNIFDGAHLLRQLMPLNTLLFFSKISLLDVSRSSNPEVFCRRGVLKSQRKTLAPESLIQSCILRPETLLKTTLWQKCFPVNFAKVLRNPFYIQMLVAFGRQPSQKEDIGRLVCSTLMVLVLLSYFLSLYFFINPFSSSVTFLYLWFSDIFRGYRNVTLD